ncbi:MAG: S-methyl-5-thioribose-1-phosphate isomerase [Candidatus Zixiibacteriota bacterium]
MTVQPLQRIGNQVRLLDQTKLPTEVLYRDLGDYREIIQSIRRLEVRGAPLIGITAAYALAVAVAQSGSADIDVIHRLGEEIRAARPTAVNLSWAIDRCLRKLEESSPVGHSQTVNLLWDEAEAIHEEDRQMCRRIGEFGASLIRKGDTILTHCNTGALATGGIGTALGVIYVCHEQGKRVKVVADETRPLLQGARLTAWELQQAGIDVTLICDNTAGVLMRRGRIAHVIVGADRIARNGDTANKIGTYSVAVQAKWHGVPFYVAAPMSTFDDSTPSGDQIVIEERSAREVTNGFGRQTAPEGIDVYSPAFDVTPNELINCFITDQGIKPGGRFDELKH